MKREGVIAVFERQTVYEFVHTEITAGMVEDLGCIQDVINTIRALDQRYTSDTIPQGRKFTSLKDIIKIAIDDIDVRYIFVVPYVHADDINDWKVIDVYNPIVNPLHTHVLTQVGFKSTDYMHGTNRIQLKSTTSLNR